MVSEAKMGGLLGMGMMHEGLGIKQPYDAEIGRHLELKPFCVWGIQGQVGIQHIGRCLSENSFFMAVILN